jgi:hypothetical protein
VTILEFRLLRCKLRGFQWSRQNTVLRNPLDLTFAKRLLSYLKTSSVNIPPYESTKHQPF